jgi:choline kinase/uncharacterized membrane protein YbhN (UPF0104 family)
MLHRLGGEPLVARATRSLLALGLERVLVIVGHDADEVAAAARLDPRVQVVPAPDWKLGNGASLAAAAEYVGEDELFLVICGDHVFSVEALADLAQSPMPAVLVDRAPSRAAWSEGTRVRASDGLARSFSKDLPDPWIDAGAFVLSPLFFSCYADKAAEDDHSLAGSVSEFASRTPLRTLGLLPEAWWQDVDTPADLRAARSLLRRSLGKDSDGAVSRRLNRPVSTRITMALAPLRIPPALLSLLAFVIGIWAAWSLSAGRALMGGVLVQVTSVLDGVDGETARLQGVASRRGAFVDGLADRMVDAAVVAGLWLWAWDDPSRAFRITCIVCSAVTWGVLAMAVRGPISVFEIPRREEPTLWAALGGRDARMFVLTLGSLANLPIVAFFVGMATFLGSAISRLMLVIRSPNRRAVAYTSAASFLRVAGRTAARVGRILLVPTVLGVVVFVVLPRLADLREVWGIVRGLSWREDVILAALGMWNLVTYWPMLVAAMPGLSLRQAAIVSQASTAVAMTVPGGGALGVGVSYAMYESWGFSAGQVIGSAFSTFLANMSFKLLLPGISLVLLVVAGERTSGFVLGALLGIGLIVGTGSAITALLWSDRFARRAGHLAARLANRLRALVGRPAAPSWGERLVNLRSLVVTLLRERGILLMAAEIVSQLSVFLVMLATVRILGIEPGKVSWQEALAVFGLVRLASAVPIVPGNAGFAELGYTGGLIMAGGDRPEVVAAVLLFRLLTYFAQIPIGALTYLTWRRHASHRASPQNRIDIGGRPPISVPGTGQ